MDCSMPGLSVLHHLLKLAQTLTHWVSDTIQTSHPVVPFSCLQSFPASGSSLMSQFFALGGQSIDPSASTSVLPMSIQDWFPLGLTGWISLHSRGLSSLLQHHSSTALIFWHSVFFIVQLSYPYMTSRKTVALTRQTFVGKVMSLLFNMLSKFVKGFLPRSKHLLISSLNHLLIIKVSFHFSHHLQSFWSPRK